MNDLDYRDEAARQFRGLKKAADRALAQVSDDDFFAVLDPESNSIALLVKHLAGNMRSRFTDFLTSDGEKPDRHRDSEFEIAAGDTRENLMERWETGWAVTFAALEPLTAEDFSRTVPIRGEPHTLLRAINRQLVHYGYHVGQIVFLAKHFAGPAWQTLSIPKGKSEEVNRKMATSAKRPAP
ncbi:MAG TPA: DUF1572 family protein [Thermoanaerobaculia bacterium]|nr:DUF1572 family protein [Thermoanaerobaculia bacterium]